MVRSFFLFYLAIVLFGAYSTCGQNSSTTASITGVVRNSVGEVMQNVSITVRDTGTNQKRQTASDRDGVFHITALTVGTYEIRAESTGFAVYVNPQITLTLGQTTIIDFALKPAGVDEVVTVTDKLLVIDSSQTASLTSITQESIEELPVNSRNYLQFTLLAPGVAPSNTRSGGGNISTSPLGDSGFTFGGLRPRSNSISIDGLDNTDETTGSALVALSPEIVREFQIVNNGTSAEFGGSAGGAINVITKTGSNEFHGTAFTFFQNQHLNARPFARPVRPIFRRYQPGISFGGPLVRDKLFFYLAAEQEHAIADERSGIDETVRTRINTALAAGFAPRLTVRSINGGLFRTGADETEAAGKLTYLINSFNTLNYRLAFTNNRRRVEAFNTDNLADASARGSTYSKDYQATGSVISVISPKVINDLRFQVARRQFISRAGDTSGPDVEIVGLVRLGRPYDADTNRRETREQVVDTVSYIGGKHEMKTGASINHVSLKSVLSNGFGGIYAFRTVDDFIASRPAFWRQAFGTAATQLGITSFGVFVQDRWQIYQHLTLNLGARYDVEKLPTPFVTDKNNFSPRLGIAWSPSKEWVIRAGFGLFYDRMALAFLNSAIQKNGLQAFEQVAYDTAAAQIFTANGGGKALFPAPGIAPSIYRAESGFKTTYSIQTYAGVERLLGADTTIRAEILFTRGVNLPRTRNVNLLPPVVLTTANAASLGFLSPTPQQIGRLVFGQGRVDPRFNGIYQLEDSARSNYRGLSVAVNKRFSNEITALASYTLSRVTDNASDFNEQPQNPFYLRPERALSLQDVRHRLVLSGVFELPFGDAEDKAKGGQDSVVGEVFSNIEIAPIITLSSGRPFNALTGSDDERSGAFPPASRPFGFSRNSLHTPSFFNTDLRIVKYVPLPELTKVAKLDLAFEFFNLFNKRNVVVINQFYGSNAGSLPSFGRPIFADPRRQFRFSIDLEF